VSLLLFSQCCSKGWVANGGTCPGAHQHTFSAIWKRAFNRNLDHNMPKNAYFWKKL